MCAPYNPAPPHRLAARIMWRVEREGTGLTEGCLVSVDDLQNHVEHFGEEEQKELRMDVDTFLQYWPPQSQQFSMQYISHIFGVVRFLPKSGWVVGVAAGSVRLRFPDAAGSEGGGRGQGVRWKGSEASNKEPTWLPFWSCFTVRSYLPVSEVSIPHTNYTLSPSSQFD